MDGFRSDQPFRPLPSRKCCLRPQQFLERTPIRDYDRRMPDRLCPYCARMKSQEQFTDEHVVPAALGGNITPKNPFKLRTCRRCNTACGRHVDGPFIRSWTTSNDRAAHARKYLDLSRGAIVPLVYLG